LGQTIVIPILLATLIASAFLISTSDKDSLGCRGVACLAAVAVVLGRLFTTRAATDFAMAFSQYREPFIVRSLTPHPGCGAWA
jgi:hypothetical protein